MNNNLEKIGPLPLDVSFLNIFSCFLSLFYSEIEVWELFGSITPNKLFKTFVVSKVNCYGKQIGKFLFEFFISRLKYMKILHRNSQNFRLVKTARRLVKRADRCAIARVSFTRFPDDRPFLRSSGASLGNMFLHHLYICIVIVKLWPKVPNKFLWKSGINNILFLYIS